MLTSVPMALGPDWLNPDVLLTDLGGIALWVGALIIFAECGLLLGFFLPGDSLLFTIGLFIGRGSIGTPIWVACLVVSIAAFLGNVVGYEIGAAAGPSVFSRNSRIFKQEYVDKTMSFFDRYGPRAIVLARFVPIVRTFITVTAGVGRMDRRKYWTYSLIGAVLWASGVTLLGRALGKVPLFRDHLEAGLLLLVVISVIPMFIEAYRARRHSGSDAGSGAAGSHGGAASTMARRGSHGDDPWAPPPAAEATPGSDATIPAGIPVHGSQRYDGSPSARPDQGYAGDPSYADQEHPGVDHYGNEPAPTSYQEIRRRARDTEER